MGEPSIRFPVLRATAAILPPSVKEPLPSPVTNNWLRRTAAAGVWLCCLTLVGVWLFMLVAGDRWWPGTLMLFGPRWLAAVPALLMLPFMPLLRPRYSWMLVGAGLFILFPLMGFRIPLTRLFVPAGKPLRVLTYNVAVGEVSPEAIATLIQSTQPDVIALQECRPEEYLDLLRDWHVCYDGDLLIAARYPVVNQRAVTTSHPPHRWPRSTFLHCTVADPEGPIDMTTVHLPSPRYGLTAMVDRRTILNLSQRQVLEYEIQNRDAVSARIAGELREADPNRIVMGDFNMPIESRLYRRDWSGYQNAFSSKGLGFGYTVRGSRRGWTVAIRIDHVLTHGNWRVARCWLGPDMGSDHLPVVAELVIDK